jgi:DNA-binding response OmpR family regulator
MRLLLVEPHCVLARALKMGLDEEGFLVEVVGDLDGAEARLQERKYDVILLDLPTDNGPDIVRRWRRGGLLAPVLASAKPGRESERRTDPATGGFGTFIKPFLFAHLVDRLRALVRTGWTEGERESIELDFHRV